MAMSDPHPAFPAMQILDEIAEALEERQNAAHVTISIIPDDDPSNRREIRINGQDIGKTSHALRRAVAREEAL